MSVEPSSSPSLTAGQRQLYWARVGVVLALASATIALYETGRSPAQAQDLGRDRAQSIVSTFYSALVASRPDEIERRLAQTTTSDWQNCADNDACQSRTETLGRWTSRIAVVPDMRWEQRDLMVAGDRIVVRGQVSGTPVAPFLGVAGGGRSFSVMTLDVHEIRNGKIARTHHVENMAQAIRQLSSEDRP